MDGYSIFFSRSPWSRSWYSMQALSSNQFWHVKASMRFPDRWFACPCPSGDMSHTYARGLFAPYQGEIRMENRLFLGPCRLLRTDFLQCRPTNLRSPQEGRKVFSYTKEIISAERPSWFWWYVMKLSKPQILDYHKMRMTEDSKGCKAKMWGRDTLQRQHNSICIIDIAIAVYSVLKEMQMIG